MKQQEQKPQYAYQTADQEYLHNMLGELRMIRKTVKSMNLVVQIMGLIMLLGVLAGCALMLLGGSLF